MVQTLCQDDVALYVSRCCADIERNRSKKWDFFLQEAMPCTHGPSLYVWMSAVVGAVLIAYDYECAKEQQALKNKHFWLRGCGPSLYNKPLDLVLEDLKMRPWNHQATFFIHTSWWWTVANTSCGHGFSMHLRKVSCLGHISVSPFLAPVGSTSFSSGLLEAPSMGESEVETFLPEQRVSERKLGVVASFLVGFASSHRMPLCLAPGQAAKPFSLLGQDPRQRGHWRRSNLGPNQKAFISVCGDHLLGNPDRSHSSSKLSEGNLHPLWLLGWQSWPARRRLYLALPATSPAASMASLACRVIGKTPLVFSWKNVHKWELVVALGVWRAKSRREPLASGIHCVHWTQALRSKKPSSMEWKKVRPVRQKKWPLPLLLTLSSMQRAMHPSLPPWRERSQPSSAKKWCCQKKNHFPSRSIRNRENHICGNGFSRSVDGVHSEDAKLCVNVGGLWSPQVFSRLQPRRWQQLPEMPQRNVRAEEQVSLWQGAGLDGHS